MRRTLIATFIALFCIAASHAQKAEVWNHPGIEYGTNNGDGYFNTALDITKVELKGTETIVHMKVSKRSDEYFGFSSKTYLSADGRRYQALSADGIEFDTYTRTGKDGSLDIAFHFPPLPQGIKSFDFMEGEEPGAFQIKGIKPIEECWKQLLPSYWRNDKTGDWEIAFFEDFAIYRCQFWDYSRCDVDSRTGKAEMVLCNGSDKLKVSIGKNKKGRRTIEIGSRKLQCSMITGRFMPPYPVKDTRTDFVDNGYRMDTTIVRGWIKDMPEQYRSRRTFEFSCYDFFTGKPSSVYADLDPLGRFTVKIPMLNSSEFYCDWSRCYVRTMLEPGKTYFMLYDFKEGRRFFMGDDVRLQNELFKYPLDWESIRMEQGNDFDTYTASVDSLLRARNACIDSLCQADPSLSARFKAYRKGNTLSLLAFDFGQSRFNTTDFSLPDNARKYAYETFWTKTEMPVTLHRRTRRFITDFIADMLHDSRFAFDWNILDHITEFELNDTDKELLTRWTALTKEANRRIEAAPTMKEKMSIAQEINTQNAGLFKEAQSIIMRKDVRSHMFITELKHHARMLDSLKAAPIVKDAVLCNFVNQRIEDECQSMDKRVIDTLKALAQHPIGIELAEASNNRYLALANREFDKVVLKSSGNLHGITESEALLQKILEPFKGKIVLLDIWGTWCSPCKEALKHSTEEYARLSKYDIAYVYLANNSPKDSWENVIKMYNVSGENVAHYNLPQEQQEAIERFLNVQHYPTYKLFDREGNLLDIEVDAREIDKLERLIMQLQRE